MRKIPIGISDFKELISENYYYVDKSLFIKEILDDGSKVILIPRPRRFGKTLNMSMLKYFFEKSDEDNRYLFEKLKINNYKEIMDMQGKYPVIYITFKDIKYSNWEDCLSGLKKIIRNEFVKHKYLLEEDILDKYEKIEFKSILESEAEYVDFLESLKVLSKYLAKYYKQKTVVLIDEYDVPIQSGYLNNYYGKVIEFMRIFLSAVLKDNEYLQKGVLTGILRVAKESIFSGLNNLKVCTILKNHYSDKFGFLENEVKEILKYYNIESEMDEVRKWYNGYIFGKNVIYNPWSILNYVDNYEKGYRPYWVNTSSNDLVKIILTKSGEFIKKDLEDLIKGKDIVKTINEDIVMKDIDKSSENVWSFLLFSGYLKVVNEEFKRGKTYCNLKIPNLEVAYLYEEIIMSWFDESINNDKFNIMLKSLVNGDIKTFSKILKEFVLSSISYFDTGGNESEKVYHAFVLGMLVALCDDYEVKSNRESGYGRYDVALIPKDKSKIGIIMEFKKVDKDDKENLEIAAQNAINQIKNKNYKLDLLDRGIKNIIELGIAFEGKDVLVMQS
ncbi:AAA family ATPase [Tepidibacter thalassicus]|uniref:PD-(D/E)XK nuclease superfamily protein n=1 Tax=Tepidibacter thalassicus DSM 15285 TaxID=1123350 RepID=A0A1M5SHG7_9FIRM|nr:AAA family ATPase [Tepidibacter thalassicus]SHH37850.1 PD-(D/E)XK nuclease superfamily protein [Tepidibacter thalassicus DSM 15285]